MIGTLPDTLADRSIIIELARKTPREKIVKTGFGFAQSQLETRRQLMRFAADNLKALKKIQPKVPTSGNDRADDNWSPLFAIAEILGGSWPDRMKDSMSRLADFGDDGLGVKLLEDIQGILKDALADRIFSADLVNALKELTESPWADWNRGKGLTTNGLSRLLKPFGIKSKKIRIDDQVLMGYELKSFKNSFSRYIPPISSGTTEQANDINSLDEKQNGTKEGDVPFENCSKPPESLSCSTVPDEIPPSGEKEKNEEEFHDGMEFSEDE
jgi:putative DNA primase/helicase